jgi:hypothetical protein
MASTMRVRPAAGGSAYGQAGSRARAENPHRRSIETPAKLELLIVCINRNIHTLNIVTMIIEDSRVGRAFRRVCGPKADIYEAGAVSDQSWLSYDSGVTNWKAFASQLGVPPFPAPTEALKAWIKWLVDEEYSATTVDCYMTAVSIGHDERELPINRRALRKVLKAAREEADNVSPPRKAAPLRAPETKALLKTCSIKRPGDCRDAVGTLVSLSCGLRQNELTRLDWLREGPAGNDRRGYMRPVRGATRWFC